jgi:fructose-1,6-bisphosphatase/inositol monophosphatase family enzyme
MKKLFNAEDFAFLKGIVIEAGERALAIQKKTITVSRKNDTSIVTQADVEVQDFLIESIISRYPGCNLVHEENFKDLSMSIEEDTISFIIDPIDGTAMFSMYLPIWCVSVGIFRGYEPLYGFVYSPSSSMFFYNDDDQAYLNDIPTVVADSITIDTETNIFYASELHNTYTIGFPGKTRNLGSTALQACLIIDNIRNRSIAFVGKAYLWDWAGALPIILKGYGNVCYLNGTPLNYKEIFHNGYKMSDHVIAYNSIPYDRLMEFFHKE